MEERKIATRLTPKVKEFIRKKFNTDYYDNHNERNYFHYPNYRNNKGFINGEHSSGILKGNYTLVEEQEFLEYFKEEFTPKRGDYVLVSDDKKTWYKRIYLNNIIGSEYPFVVVSHGFEEEYLKGDKFKHIECKYMKPIRKQITKAEAEKLLDADIID